MIFTVNYFIFLFQVGSIYWSEILLFAYFFLVANLLSDAVLVFSPLYVLRRLRLPDNQRRLIFSCFMGSAFVSLACIMTAVFQFVQAPWNANGQIRVILGYIEVR